MSPWRKLSTWYTRLRDDTGRVRKVSLGTTHKKTAERMETMFSALREQGDGWAINAMVQGLVSPLRVFNAVAQGRAGLDALKAELDDTDLALHAAAWERWVGRHVGPETVARYAWQVNVLFSTVGTTKRELTRSAISAALLDLGVSSTTARHYHAAWSSFFTYCVEAGAVTDNPMREIRAPKPNAAKELYLDEADMVRLVRAHAAPFRALSAFLHGAGVEVSAALRVRARDVNEAKHTIRARGTKTHTRDRLVKVDEWAWGFVVESLESRHPDALVWPIVEGQDHDPAAMKRASAAVYRALKIALEALPDLPQKYTVHDARHSYAVRHVKRGTSYERIAHNLGHVNASQVIHVYGKFRLKDAEIEDAAPVAAPATSEPAQRRGA